MWEGPQIRRTIRDAWGVVGPMVPAAERLDLSDLLFLAANTSTARNVCLVKFRMIRCADFVLDFVYDLLNSVGRRD